MTQSTWLFRALSSGFVVVTATLAAGSRNADAQAPVPTPSNAAHAMFVPNTLIPRLAMGVRRDVTDSREIAELRDRPGGAIVGRAPLFSPMYVHGEQQVGGQDWVLLASGYTDENGGARGWIPRSEVEVFATRYGYVLRDKENATEFFPTPAAAYAIVPGMGSKREASPSQSAFVLGRPGAADWQPSRRTDRMPFMELEFERQSGYPSTTPSTATPYDGRLVRVGAICGGPVEEDVLAKLQAQAARNAAIEMLFVVDETWSMKEFFAGVADFISDVGKAAGDGLVRQPRIAVSYYTDGPPGERTTCVPLQKATPQVVAALGDSVRQHKQQMPSGDYVNPPERMLEGMRDAINKAKFMKGVTSIVVVIGDTGHEPKDPDKAKLLEEVANMIADEGLMVFFVHVGLKGDELTPDQALFKRDAEAVGQRVGQLNKALADRVTYSTANADNLTARLEASRQEADRLTEQARLMAGRITSRNTATMPGPALIAKMEKQGVDLAQFNVSHQQLYVPSYAWVTSPRGEEGKEKRRIQLCRYFCLAAEEQDALAALLDSVSKDVDGGAAVDHDKAVQAFVKSLGTLTNDSAVVEAAQANWKKLGSARTAGTFLERYVGLDLQSGVLFSTGPLAATAEAEDARKALRTLTTNVRAASRDKQRFWFEAGSVAPP